MPFCLELYRLWYAFAAVRAAVQVLLKSDRYRDAAEWYVLDLSGNSPVDVHPPFTFRAFGGDTVTCEYSAETHCGSPIWILNVSKGCLLKSGQRWWHCQNRTVKSGSRRIYELISGSQLTIWPVGFTIHVYLRYAGLSRSTETSASISEVLPLFT